MTLPTTKVEQFYKIWRPLLNFVNEKLKVVPDLSGKGPADSIDVDRAIKVRDALWKNEKLIDQFIAENPARLTDVDFRIVQSWKHRKQGTFIVYKTLKKYAIFISQEKKADVFAVKGLYSSFEEMFGPYLPIMVVTVLLPVEDDITADGLFQSYNISFGSGIRGELKDIYDDAKERGEIITTLLPNQQPQSMETTAARVEAINAKVLDAFQRYQYKAGSSPKTVERDTNNITSAAQYLLLQQSEPTSLRDFEPEAIKNYLLSMPEKARKPASLSLKRFISFLRETGRMDWNEAENMLDELKQPI